jgi:transmembrane sensor
MNVERFFETLRLEQDSERERANYVARARASSRLQVPPRRARRIVWLVAGLAAALGAMCALVLFHTHVDRRDVVLHFDVGNDHEAGRLNAFIAAPMDRELPLTFTDGTKLLLGMGAGMRVAGTDVAGAHVMLEHGRMSAAVVHRANSRWLLEVGPFQVAVVGTRFDVAWEPTEQAMVLELFEGAVVVNGSFLRESVRVGGGQTLRLFCNDHRVELVDGAAEAPAILTPGPVDDVTPMAAVASGEGQRLRAERPSSPTAATWQELAAAGKYHDSLALAEQAGFDSECRRASGQDLLLLGDAARLSGSPARARQAYQAARSKIPGGGRATYGLGLVDFDQQGDFASAARWFDRYLQDQPHGALRGEAMGRLMESLERSGQKSRAQQLAGQYLTEFPTGGRSALARRLVAASP